MDQGVETNEDVKIGLLTGEDAWEKFRELSVEASRDFPEIFSDKLTPRNYNDVESWKYLTRERTAETPLRVTWLQAAWKDNELIGMLRAYRDMSSGTGNVRLADFYLRPSLHGRGIGTRLFASMMKELRKDSTVKKVALIAPASQTSAVKLYREFGFRKRKTLEPLLPAFAKHEEILMTRNLHK
ncbi:GNAT family N-acetyltransferase [Candidatus Kaiserbacteria bacterium]|nr:GNAT family N-acetyltransferase [Candidatus Kaiserbacteria bacterium]